MSIDVTKHYVEINIVLDDDVEGLDPVDVKKLDGKTEIEPVVDADLDRFAKFYADTLANGNLSKFERAAIKTYLAWKLNVAKGP